MKMASRTRPLRFAGFHSFLSGYKSRSGLSNIWLHPFKASGITAKGQHPLTWSIFQGVNVILDFPYYTSHLFIPLPSAAIRPSLCLHPNVSAFGRDIRFGHNWFKLESAILV